MRALVAFAAVGLSLTALGACGDSAGSPSSTTLGLTSTNWATIATVPPVDATTVPPKAGDTVPTDQTYKIQAGDTSRIGVAKKCGVSVTDLDAANASTPNYSAFYAGLEIKVPAGGIFGCGGAATDTTTTVAGGQTGTTTAPTPTTAGATTTTVAGGGSNCAAGSYTIVANDYPGGVAKKFDVTVDQLNAANAATKGYSSFYVGLVIVIPPKSTCA
jgi:LysM repeat protein